MTKRFKWFMMVIGVLGISLLLAGVFVTGQHKIPKKGWLHAHGVAEETSTITIDPQVGETFAPAPPSAAPSLTAAQAWADYAQLNGDSSTAIPANVSVTLGLLTLPIGPTGPNNSEAYTADNELAYGYSWHSCPVPTGFNTTVPPNPCIEWNFLDANTGHQIDDTWQQG